jgi:CRISPR/Cas system-associated endoribonuclease Cas2
MGIKKLQQGLLTSLFKTITSEEQGQVLQRRIEQSNDNVNQSIRDAPLFQRYKNLASSACVQNSGQFLCHVT